MNVIFVIDGEIKLRKEFTIEEVNCMLNAKNIRIEISEGKKVIYSIANSTVDIEEKKAVLKLEIATMI